MSQTDVILFNARYQTAHAEITEPTRFVTFSQYYRRRWQRLIGPVGTAILLELRGRCYYNFSTGERRDTIIASQRDLADAIGISVDTFQRQLGKAGQAEDIKANQALRRFVWVEERFERSDKGRVRQMENIYHVSMDDPVHPDDLARLEQLIEEYGRREQNEKARVQNGRKTILPATKNQPEPQSAVLREEAIPEPQSAAGGHRNLRQGSPQSAVLSEDRLLFFTENQKEQTLNVPTKHQIFDLIEQEETVLINQASSKIITHQSAEWLKSSKKTPVFSSVSEDYLTIEVLALVEELRDWGSERRHRQLLALCEQHGLNGLVQQALTATRKRQARESRSGLLEKPGAYYQATLIKLLEGKQVFVPKASDGEDPDDVRRMVQESLGLC